mgnify:CR=1 FL=1
MEAILFKQNNFTAAFAYAHSLRNRLFLNVYMMKNSVPNTRLEY